MSISPLDLLTLNPDRKVSFLSDKINPIACSVSGFGLACFMNWVLRRPVFSGVQNHIALVVAGAGLGIVVDKRRDAYLAERDAVLRHYIELHPEDFPTVERKKYADVLEVWAPIR